MESFAFGVGILLAIFGPLLLIPVIWLVYRMAARPVLLPSVGRRLSGRSARMVALALSTIVVVGAVGLSYLPGRREFDRLCVQHATPSVAERVRASSYYRNRLFPYEADQILEEDGFTSVEAPHPYEAGTLVRYSRAPDGDVRQEEIAAPESSYGVRHTLSQLSHGIVMTEKVVYEMATDRVLARAAHVVYQGGPLSLFLGTLGMASCPDIRSADGSRHFGTFYDLEALVLRGD